MSRLLSLLFVLALVHASAQRLDFQVSWGHEFDGASRSTLYDIIGHDATGIYAIRVRYGTTDIASYTLERYDRRYLPIREQKLEIIENGEQARIQYVLYIKAQLYMFYLIRNRTTGSNDFFVRMINKSTLQPEAGKMKLGISTDKMFAREMTFKFSVSRDSSKVAISYEYPKGLSETKGYGFFVLDDNMRLLWKPQVDLPDEKGLFVVENFKVDNAGNVYILGVRYTEIRRNKRDGKPDYTYEIIAWSDNGRTLRNYPIKLDGHFVTDMQIEVIDTKNLVCAGFYSSSGTFSIRGTYFLTVDIATKEIKTSSLKDFDSEFVVDNLSERDASNVRRTSRDAMAELYDYDLNNLLVGKDGSAILIGEQYFIEEYQTTSELSMRLRVHKSRNYYYNDIIAVKIDPAGQISWAHKIAKSQRTTGDYGYSSSYALAIVQGKICFFFNDRPENVHYNGVGRPLPYTPRNSIVILASLNQRGEQTRQPIFTHNDVAITRPRSSRQISNSHVVLFGQRNTRQQFVGVVFE